MRKRSVRNKLILYITVAMLIPVILIGFFSYNKSSEILEEKMKNNNQQLVIEINNSFTNFLSGIENQVQALVEDNTFGNAAIRSSSSYGAGQDEDYDAMVLDLLANAQLSSENILNAKFTTFEGQSYIYPDEHLVLEQDPREADWYQRAINDDRQAVWTAPYKTGREEKYVITVAKTVKIGKKVVGVLGMDISIDALSKNFSDRVIGKEGYIFVTDKEGITLYHPNSEVFMTDIATGLSFWDAAKNSPSGTERYGYEGDQKQLSFTTNEKTGWKIMGTMNLNELHDETNIIRDATLLMIGISFILSIILAIFIALIITRALNKLKVSFAKASEGDLTTIVNIKARDEFGEIGNNFNRMMENIKELIKSVKESAHTILDFSSSLDGVSKEVTISTNEVATTVEEIAASSNEQAKDAENGARKVSELAEKIEDVEGLNNNMNDIAIEAGKLSDKGLETVKVLIEKTDENNKSYLKINDLILEVDKSSDEISTITGTISDIAEQTNLLALNAAIEAARAGEHGQGFAVVADEVRKLAEESSLAAQKVKDIINEIQTKSDSAVEAMQESKTTMSEHEKAVDETENIFNEITSAIKTIIERVGEIKEHSLVMSDRKNEIVTVIENLSAVSEETSAATQQVSASTEEQLATMEEVASHTQELKGLADKLQEVINRFKVEDN